MPSFGTSIWSETLSCRHVWMAFAALLVVIGLYYCSRADNGLAHAGQSVVTTVLFPYGVERHIGRRSYMEDRHVAAGEMLGDPSKSLYAVFDGHGGSHAAEFCKLHLPRILSATEGLATDPPTSLIKAFEDVDTEVRRLCIVVPCLVACSLHACVYLWLASCPRLRPRVQWFRALSLLLRVTGSVLQRCAAVSPTSESSTAPLG
jgi:hypothetical protein